MNTKHTPGPWVVYDADGSIGSVETVDGTAVAYAQIVGTLGRQDEQMKEIRRANARLIAASPCLLEALQLVRDYVVTLKGAGHDYQLAIDAAIAKATGEDAP